MPSQSEHAGRASVGGAPPAGRAQVGRASVSARAAVAAIGAGPAAHGAEPNADVLDSHGPDRGAVVRSSDDRMRSKRKRARRRNIAIAATAVFLMLAGGGIVGGTWFFDDVELPQNIGANLKQSTVVTYSDGTTMARLGDETRTIVTIDQISDDAEHAVVAAEDLTFYTNDGVDYKGIIRALVNNATGGERQGASTITQQYAKAVLERKEVSYGRKLREAVLAVKIKENYDNNTIMQMYLNTVYFGRHAYGIEAAAQAYFNKSAKDLTKAEGMVLAGVIKQPVGPDGISGSPYDPKANAQMAADRFNYIKSNMVKLNYLKSDEAAAMQYPTNVIDYNPKDVKLRSQWGMDQPEGLIVHHVMDEIWKLTTPKGEKRFPDVRNAGLKIVTTINKEMQGYARDAAATNSANFKAQKFKNSDDLRAALVAVEPGTGQVKAYYGGPDGIGTDYAGIYQDPITSKTDPNATDVPWSQGGAHPPGSTMKVYTMAAGLIAGYTTDSKWNADQHEFPRSGRNKGNPVKNSSTPQCQLGPTACTLDESVWESLNTPLYALTEAVGASKVIEVAKAAGVRFMWTDKDERIDLNTLDPKSTSKYFNTEVGIGQYAITPLEHAAGVAAIAAKGRAAKAHFIDKIYKNGETTPVYSGAVGAKAIPGLTPAMVDDMCVTLQKVVDHYSKYVKITGRDMAGKSGTWQLGAGPENAHAWFVGYSAYDTSKKSSNLAAAAWLGNKKDLKALEFTNGNSIIGGQGAGPIWKAFMAKALNSAPKIKFGPPGNTGTITMGNGKIVPPSTPPDGNPQPGGGPGDGQGNNQPGGTPTSIQPNPLPSRRNR